MSLIKGHLFRGYDHKEVCGNCSNWDHSNCIVRNHHTGFNNWCEKHIRDLEKPDYICHPSILRLVREQRFKEQELLKVGSQTSIMDFCV